MRKLQRKVIISLALLSDMLLVTAVCLYLRSDAPRAMRADSASVAEQQEDPVRRFRTEREQLRSRQTGQLNDIIHSDSTDGETLSQAKRQLMDLMAREETEQRLEGILQMRGFEDALVTVSEASVNVILDRRPVSRQDSALILDLVLRETGITAGNVKILSINQ